MTALVALLLLESGSPPPALTVAVSVNTTGIGGVWVWIVTMASDPVGSAPKSQVSWAIPWQVPTLEEMEADVKFPDSVLLSVTAVASCGPRLFTQTPTRGFGGSPMALVVSSTLTRSEEHTSE